MKKIVFAALAAAFVTAQAQAGNVKLETKFADPVGGRKDFTEYKVEYNDTYGPVNYGVELATTQSDHAGSVRSAISGKLGTSLKAPLGFTISPNVELGQALRSGDNFTFWGAEVKASRAVFGPVSANVGYRHREDFGNDKFNEERLSAGVEVALTEKHAVGSTYYRTRGTSDSDAIGVFYKISF